MKVTIVSGIKQSEFNHEFDSLAKSIAQLKANNDVNVFNVNDLNIHECTGCWTCWIKKPGNCVFDDDMIDIYKSMIKSDLLIYVSSIKAGFLQSEIKQVLDRMFALILPHMMVLKGELHHIPRYDEQAKLGLVVVSPDGCGMEQKEILKEYMHRISLNFNKDKGNFIHYFNADNQKELLNAINNI